VTSVPAKSLQQDHRIGYAKPGYDADLVVWDSHPLSIGATPLQVYVDGKATLDPQKVKESMPEVRTVRNAGIEQSRTRPTVDYEYKKKTCTNVEQHRGRIVITGITTSFLSTSAQESSESGNVTAVIEGGKVVCLGLHGTCVSTEGTDPTFHVANGYLLPGLTAVSRSLGLREIAGESSTGDGAINKKAAVNDPEKVVYAKYGIHLEGRGFDRARIGGVTRAITTPLTQGGFSGGVSVGIKTGGKSTVLDGGIFEPDVALHFAVGEEAKGKFLSHRHIFG
jgi:imidazolonepropionase-like amidohydrolase